jgi:hypothetical protein
MRDIRASVMVMVALMLSTGCGDPAYVTVDDPAAEVLPPDTQLPFFYAYEDGTNAYVVLFSKDGVMQFGPYESAIAHTTDTAIILEGDVWKRLLTDGTLTGTDIPSPIVDGVQAREIEPGVYTLVDKNGDRLIEADYEELAGLVPESHDGDSSPGSDFVAARKDGNWGYIDLQGRVVIPFTYRSATPFVGGHARVGVLDDRGDLRFVHIDTQGQRVSPEFRNIDAFDASTGLALARTGELWGYVDRSYKWVIDPIWKSAFPFSDGLAQVEQAPRGYGYIDASGGVVIDYQFESAGSFIDGWAAVEKEVTVNGEEIDLWGTIDRTGNWLATPQFRSAVRSPLNRDYMIVGTEEYQGIVDRHGHWRFRVPRPLEDTESKATGHPE